MPTVITVPIAQRAKSIKFGAAYSPAMSFNPDKNLFYAMSGVLTGMGLTVNTVPVPDEVTVDPGTFIQRGIIVSVTSAQVIQFPDPLPGIPIFLVAENANEVITSNVTIGFTTAPAADSVVIASWAAPITTTVFEEPQKISILEIVNTLNGISKLVIKRHHIVAIAGQTVFTVPSPFNDYVLGANKIWVFRNGQKLEHFLDYNETTTSSITLTFGATAGDEMELITLKSAPPITSIALNDLTDVTTALADAIKDTGVVRVTPATLVNPLATIADINAATLAPFRFMSTKVRTTGTFGFNTGGALLDAPAPDGGGPFEVSVSTTGGSVMIQVYGHGGAINSGNPAATGTGLKIDTVEVSGVYVVGHPAGGVDLGIGGASAQGGGQNYSNGDVGYLYMTTLAAGPHTFRLTYGYAGAGSGYIAAIPFSPLRMVVWYN
jgi:hypothetical protein